MEFKPPSTFGLGSYEVTTREIKMDWKLIGQKVRDYRVEKRIPLYSLAKGINEKTSVVSRFELNQIRPVDLSVGEILTEKRLLIIFSKIVKFFDVFENYYTSENKSKLRKLYEDQIEETSEAREE